MSTRPASYVVYATFPLHPRVLPLAFHGREPAQGALDETLAYLDYPGFQLWLVSPDGELLDYRAAL